MLSVGQLNMSESFLKFESGNPPDRKTREAINFLARRGLNWNMICKNEPECSVTWKSTTSDVDFGEPYKRQTVNLFSLFFFLLLKFIKRQMLLEQEPTKKTK